MGIISDIKAMTDVQRIKNGGTAMLSISQIVNLIINLPDARKKLSPVEFERVYSLYKEMRKCKTKLPTDIEAYISTTIKIIKEFDKIAPYEKYSGGNELEFSFMMADIRGKNYERIQELGKQISEMEAALKEHDKAFAQNKPILAEAYSDEELIKMVTAGEFPPDRIKEYVNNRESLKLFISNAPRIRESIVKMISDMEAELNRLLSEGEPDSFPAKEELANLEAMTQTKRSSSIEAVQHKDGDLYIKLRTGSFYLYQNFPREVYLEMMNAPSMGEYYRQHIDGKYFRTKL